MKKQHILLALFLILGICNKAKPQSLAWARQMGGASGIFPSYTDMARSMALDANGNVYTTGIYIGPADFDPGPGTSTLPSGAFGTYDAFISKLDASGNFLWAKKIGGTGDDWGMALGVDAAANVYVTGLFKNTVDFDPGPGTFVLNSDNVGSIFICKLDSSGNFVWAKKMGGTLPSSGKSMAVDPNGNVYSTGIFEGTCDFDPGPGSFNLTSPGGLGSQDVFISKLDSSGNFVWAKKLGGSGSDFGNALALDATGHIAITGFFENTADFDPGSGVFNLTSSGVHDIFICKLDTSGDFIWAKTMGGTLNDEANSVTIDHQGNVILVGGFESNVDFDPGTGSFNLTASGGSGLPDIFICKLDASGNFVWARQIGSNLNDIGFSVTHDSDGRIISSGYFTSTADFNPDAGIANLTSAGGSDVFISTLDSNGNYISALQLGGTGYDECFTVKVDEGGNRYATGYFAETADFDPGTGTFSLSAAGTTDVYVAKLNGTPTGIPPMDNGIQDFAVIPNPSTGNFIIKSNQLIQSGDLEIVSMQGKQVYLKQISNAFELKVPSENLLPGLYMARISEGKRRYSQKVIIQGRQ